MPEPLSVCVSAVQDKEQRARLIELFDGYLNVEKGWFSDMKDKMMRYLEENISVKANKDKITRDLWQYLTTEFAKAGDSCQGYIKDAAYYVVLQRVAKGESDILRSVFRTEFFSGLGGIIGAAEVKKHILSYKPQMGGKRSKTRRAKASKKTAKKASKKASRKHK